MKQKPILTGLAYLLEHASFADKEAREKTEARIKPLVDVTNVSTMPSPHTRIDYSDGEFGPAMFHYLPEGYDPVHIASAYGFDLVWMEMANDQTDEAMYLYDLYSDDGRIEIVLTSWKPQPPEGTKIAAMFDSDNGPIAIFLKPITKSSRVSLGMEKGE